MCKNLLIPLFTECSVAKIWSPGVFEYIIGCFEIITDRFRRIRWCTVIDSPLAQLHKLQGEALIDNESAQTV